MGTYSDSQQPSLENLLLPARQWQEGRFVVAVPQYPNNKWPKNVGQIEHLPPARHRWFYNSQLFALNITRVDMVRAGYSPSVRLFEAAACGTPIISDYWQGLETIFEIGKEILIAESPADTLQYLQKTPEAERIAIGARARTRVLAQHTAAHRAAELEGYVLERITLYSSFKN